VNSFLESEFGRQPEAFLPLLQASVASEKIALTFLAVGGDAIASCFLGGNRTKITEFDQRPTPSALSLIFLGISHSPDPGDKCLSQQRLTGQEILGVFPQKLKSISGLRVARFFWCMMPKTGKT
jgi:hypothetical protein